MTAPLAHARCTLSIGTNTQTHKTNQLDPNPTPPPPPIPPKKIEGSFPKYGNDDDRADAIASWIAQQFSNKLAAQPTYRNSVPTLSVLTITSNVVYG
jgi:hypothetical protein